MRLTGKSRWRKSITTGQTAETITITLLRGPLGKRALVVRNERINFRRDQLGEVEYLDRKIVDLERNCVSMAQEMELKDKGKVAAIDRLCSLSGW